MISTMENEGRYFCTDGIRGVYGKTPIHEDFFEKIGQAVVKLLHHEGHQYPTIVIGRDTRHSGMSLKLALIRGIGKSAKIWDVGVLSTPAIAFLSRNCEASVAISITASHNSATDNGMKFFNGNGEKWPMEMEIRLEKLLQETETVERNSPMIFSGHGMQREGIGIYVDHFLKTFSGKPLRNLRIVLDCAHGATHSFGPSLLEELGAEVTCIGNEPTGNNINDNVGSEHGETLRQCVRDSSAHLGIALDGDGDRVLICDAAGKLISGEHLLALLALHHKKLGKLATNSIVTTVHSNMALDRHLKKNGIKTFRSDVGDRNVYVAMKEMGCNLGGEASGHIIFPDFSPAADGLFTAVSFVETLSDGKNFVWEKSPHFFPLDASILLSIPVEKKIPIEEMEPLQNTLDAIRKKMKKERFGRVLIRYSGTENKLRLCVEARTMMLAETFAKQLLKSLSPLQ